MQVVAAKYEKYLTSKEWEYGLTDVSGVANNDKYVKSMYETARVSGYRYILQVREFGYSLQDLRFLDWLASQRWPY